jgi:pimeloyl-ACP methyl ester carboxylesterase
MDKDISIVKYLLMFLRLLGNLVLAALVLALSVAIMFSGFVAMYLPMWETAGLEEQALEGAWMWIDDQPIYYRTWGSQDAPTVVLVHGDVVEGSTIWNTTAPMLAEGGLRVIAVDLLGYGHSGRGTEPIYSVRAQTGVLAQFLNESRIKDATLVGHGDGAGVVLQLAVEQPQFVQRMVLISPDTESQDSFLRRAVARIPYFGRAAAWAYQSGGPLWRSARMRMVSDPSRFTRDYFEAAGKATHIVGTAETLRMMALSDADDNLPEAIPGLVMPALILVGDEDRTLSEDRAADLAGQFADGEMAVLPRAGYAAQIDQPVLVGDAIVRFAGEQPVTQP